MPQEIVFNGGVVETGAPLAEVEVTSAVDWVDLVDTSGVARKGYELIFQNVVSDRELQPAPDALLTVYLSFDGGATFHEGPYYQTTGQSNWPGEPNTGYLPVTALGVPQTLSMGFRLGIDTGDRRAFGLSGKAQVFSPGAVSDHPVNTSYVAKVYKGAIGGAAGVSPRPAHYGGGYWFGGDTHGHPFHWACLADWGGHYEGAAGQRANAFRFKMNGGGSQGWKIAGGLFRLLPL